MDLGEENNLHSHFYYTSLYLYICIYTYLHVSFEWSYTKLLIMFILGGLIRYVFSFLLFWLISSDFLEVNVQYLC